VTPADLAAAPELYEPLLEALVETGTALEVNTSGLRQAPRETYPSEGVVRRFGVLGGTGLSAGSDAHDERAFASGLEAGYRVALAAGARDLAFRRGGERVVVALPARFRQPARPNEATVQSL
jgi:histidinol-phosphatase (PHP family)